MKITSEPSHFVAEDVLMHHFKLDGLDFSYDEATREFAVCTANECVFIPRKKLKKLQKTLNKLFEKAGV